MNRWASVFAVASLAALVGACAEVEESELVYSERDGDPRLDAYDDQPSIFGQGGLNLFGSATPPEGAGLGVNSFLWRASLDTIAFMPISSADAFGGVITTDWHSLADSPDERFKLNIYILSRTLRADGVRVSVFRQTRDPAGVWRDASAPEAAGGKIEDAILTRARVMRHERLERTD